VLLIFKEVAVLGVDRSLQLEVLVQPAVVLLQDDKLVQKQTTGLIRTSNASVGVESGTLKNLDAAVKDVQDELQPGVGGQMDAVGLQLWVGETRKKMKIRGASI